MVVGSVDVGVVVGAWVWLLECGCGCWECVCGCGCWSVGVVVGSVCVDVVVGVWVWLLGVCGWVWLLECGCGCGWECVGGSGHHMYGWVVVTSGWVGGCGHYMWVGGWVWSCVWVSAAIACVWVGVVVMCMYMGGCGFYVHVYGLVCSIHVCTYIRILCEFKSIIHLPNSLAKSYVHTHTRMYILHTYVGAYIYVHIYSKLN